MALLAMVMVGLASAVGAWALFPANRFGGAFVVALAGSIAGGLVAHSGHSPADVFRFVPLDVFWSTLGAVLLSALTAVRRRSEHAQLLQPSDASFRSERRLERTD